MVAKACGPPGVLPGMCLEPKITTVGSQDTTVPITMESDARVGSHGNDTQTAKILTESDALGVNTEGDDRDGSHGD